MPTDSSPKPRRSRRLVKFFVLTIVAAVAVWFVVERFVIQADRYRPRVVEAIEEATGLPASIGGLKVDLFPSPHLIVTAFRIGEPGFQATARRIVVTAHLLALVRGRVDVQTITVDDLELRVPGDMETLSEKIQSIADRFDDDAEDSRVSIERIETTDAKVFLDESDAPFAVATASMTNVLSESVGISVAASIPLLGDLATLESEVTLVPGEDGSITLTGSGRARALDLATLLEFEDVGFAVDADFTIATEDTDTFVVAIDGSTHSETHPVLEGALFAEVRWVGGALTVDPATWEAESIRVAAAATRAEDGQIDVHFPVIEAREDGLTGLLSLVASDILEITGDATAALRAEDIRVSLGAGEDPKIESGRITVDGLAIHDRQSGQVLAGDFRARLAARDGVLHIEELTSDAFSLTGSVGLAGESAGVTLDLKGEADLRPAHFAALFEGGLVREAEGTLRVERLAGTFHNMRTLPDDLAIDASLEEAKLTFVSDEYEDTIFPLSIDIASGEDGIVTTGSAISQRLGAFLLEGLYHTADHEWLGRISTDVQRLVSGLVATEASDQFLQPVLALYGASTFWTKVTLPAEESGTITLALRREGHPGLEGTLALEAEPGAGYILGPIHVTTQLSLDALSTEIFEGVHSSGEAVVVFARDPVSKTFEMHADLSETSIRAGDSFEKRGGDPLTMTVFGDADETWAVEGIRVEILDETILLEVDESGVHADLALDLVHFARLLPEESTLHGKVTVALASSPFDLHLVLDRVGYAIGAGTRVDAISGALSTTGRYVTTEGLTFSGPGMKGTLRAGTDGERWRGTLFGTELDLSALELLIDTGLAFAPGTAAQEEPEPTGTWDDPFIGDFDLRFDQVHFRRATLEAVRLAVAADGEGIRVFELSARSGTGSIAGTVDILPGAGEGAIVTAALDFTELDGRILDELLFEEPGNVYGTLTGTLHFSAPAADPKDMMAVGSGSADWSATDGSLGKLGFATKLLTALKTVDIINLRAPSLRDEGLTYRTFSGGLVVTDGVMELEKVVLDGGAYAMNATGTINFAEDSIDVDVYVKLLQSVSNIVEKVPVIGQITKITTDLVGVNVHMKGSPYDLETAVVPLGGQSIVGIGGKAVKGVTKTIKKLIPGSGKPEEKEPASQPQEVSP